MLSSSSTNGCCGVEAAFSPSKIPFVSGRRRRISPKPTRRFSSGGSSNDGNKGGNTKGRILVLGGTGFLGQQVCREAVRRGYRATSLSRRGLPPPSDDGKRREADPDLLEKVDYRQGDARNPDSVRNILMGEGQDQDGGNYVGIVHCVGLLFDDASGLGNLNKFASGSGSLPDSESTYERITRDTAYNAIDLAAEYAEANANNKPGGFPFVFTSAAEAGWPDVPGGEFVENVLAPDFLRRYLKAKREVEGRLLGNDEGGGGSAPSPLLRPVIFRPSLIYSKERVGSYLPVGAFFVGNKVGLPFVDRPVTVQNLARAIVEAVSDPGVRGVMRYRQIDDLSGRSR